MFIVIFSFLNPLANVAYAEKFISFDISWSISGELGGGVDNEVNEPKGEIVMSNSLVYTTQRVGPWRENVATIYSSFWFFGEYMYRLNQRPFCTMLFCSLP